VAATIASLEARLLVTKLLIGAIVGLCAGALIGGLAFGALGSDATATAFLRLQNPVDLTAIAGGASQTTPDNQDNTSRFVTGEIAFLSGEGFAQAVARKMAENEPAVLNVSQASESSVITISCSGRSADEALRTVQTAIDLYGQELEQRVDVQLRTLLPTLSGWQQRDAADPTRMQDLQRLRESVELQAAEASTLSVVQPPILNHPSSQQWVIGLFLGALVGGAGVVMVLLAVRRRSGRGSLVRVLSESVDGVLLPAVDLDVPTRDADEQASLARTLYAQCPSAGTNSVILVLGASSSSGTSVVASMLEMAAAESQTASAVWPASGQHSAQTTADPPTTRIVAGGAVGDSTPIPIGAATAIILVARIEADTVAQALALRSAAASSPAPVVAVFTYRRSRTLGLGNRQPKERHSAPSSTAGVVDDERRAE
jgi:predicted amino acid-binding ACT domain protein